MMYCYGFLGSRLLFLGMTRSVSAIEGTAAGYAKCFQSDTWYEHALMRTRK